MNSLPLSLRQLQYIVAVAETRNFRRAAERCHVVQPSLSTQIATLEEALEVQIFERDRRGVMLTPAGEAIVARAKQILLEAEDLVQEAKRFRNPLSGSLRIGIIPTLAPYLLPELAPRLRAAHPELMPLWTEERTPVLVRMLQEGRLDAAIMALEADLQDLETVDLGKDSFVLTLPKNHPLAKGKGPIHLESLEDEHLLLLEDGHCLRDQALAACASVRFEERGYRATSLPTLVQMVGSGAGITLLPNLAVELETSRAPVVTRQLAKPQPFRTIVLTWRRNSFMEPALQKLAKAMRLGSF